MKVMKHTQSRALTTLERYLLMTVGSVITAFGVYFFKFPNNFSTGGVSGISLILGRLFPSPVLTPSVVMLILNALLLVVGFIFIGWILPSVLCTAPCCFP